MTNYWKNVAKLGAGYLVAKVGAASNGDENLLSDKNMTNGVLGAAAGVTFIPKAKETLDRLIESVSNGERPNLGRVAKFAAVGGTAAAIAYAIENGVHKKIAKKASDTYEAMKPAKPNLS